MYCISHKGMAKVRRKMQGEIEGWMGKGRGGRQRVGRGTAMEGEGMGRRKGHVFVIASIKS